MKDTRITHYPASKQQTFYKREVGGGKIVKFVLKAGVVQIFGRSSKHFLSMMQQRGVLLLENLLCNEDGNTMVAPKDSRFDEQNDRFPVCGPVGHILFCPCQESNKKYSNSSFVERMTEQFFISSYLT